jgi:hypothetical protein
MARRAKGKRATKATKAAKGKRPRRAGTFLEGSKRALVWGILSKKLEGKGRIKLADVSESFAKACEMDADDARNSGGLFLWNLVRLKLVRRVAKGEFALARKKGG